MVKSAKTRAAASGIGRGLILPFPDATLDIVDRAILSGSYFPGMDDGSGGSDSEETDGMKTFAYISPQALACAGTNNTDIILWIKPDLTLSPYCEGGGSAFDFVNATIGVGCEVDCQFKYQIIYDEAQLLPGKLLKASDILGVMCTGPFSTWASSLAGSEVTMVDNGDGTVTFTSQHGCEFTFFSGEGVSGVLSLEHGGTGGATINEAITNLGLVWDTWEPEVTTDGGMVVSNFTIFNANYLPIGDQTILVALSFGMDLSPALSSGLYLSAPVPILADNAMTRYPMWSSNPSPTQFDAFWLAGTADRIAIGPATGTFAAGGFVGGLNGWIRRA